MPQRADLKTRRDGSRGGPENSPAALGRGEDVGQRFALPRKVPQQTYSQKFSDDALEFDSFVANNYAPFYSNPIECTDRDAAFVLDIRSRAAHAQRGLWTPLP